MIFHLYLTLLLFCTQFQSPPAIMISSCFFNLFTQLYRVAQKERNCRYSRFSGLCSNQQLISSLCWIEHIFPIIITSRSSNLIENFSFYETFIMDCHFRDLPDFQSFEARWQINGKSQKWQSIRNYSFFSGEDTPSTDTSHLI